MTVVQGYDYGPFYDISQRIEEAKSVDEKIRWCEEGLKLLPSFVSASIKEDGDLPPIIFCRDTAPWLYMKQGRWDDAERVIKYCISCRAYFPENGKEELQFFEMFRDAACIASAYIENHQGTLQKDIYKSLSKIVSSDEMKSVMRNYELIRKEKEGKSNRLYVAKEQ